MSQTDRSPRSITARASDVTPPSTSPISSRIIEPPSFDGPATRPRRFSARLAWRGLRRHWWQALLLWLAGSSGLMALAYDRLRPTFEASSTIRVDPGPPRANGLPDDFEVFKETQARRVANPNVVANALAGHPELLKLPELIRSRDPEAEVRKALRVAVLPRTNLIEVSASSESAEQAASVVNAVIDAYLEVALDPSEEVEKRAAKLREVQTERTMAVRLKRVAIADLVKRVGSLEGTRARERDSVSIEQYGELTRQHLKADLELVEAQARLEHFRNAPIVEVSGNLSEPDPALIAAFYAVPEVAEVRVRLDRTRQEMIGAERLTKGPGDPAYTAAKKQADEAQKQLDGLWAKLKPDLLRTVRANQARDREQDLRASESNVAGLKARLAQLADRLEKLNLQSKAAGSDELTLAFARQDLNRAEAVLDSVTRSLDQLDFEAKDPAPRFRQEFQARASDVPTDHHRGRAMAAAPFGMFLAVLGLFALVELKAGRVHDPDELPGRLRLHVLGVVPPLPRSRLATGSPSGRDEARNRRDLDQFIQSLDHLRVALCSGRDSWGQARRTILITSACESEGKTTLAAQLAERCVNAGLLTLLVDADIRNPTLSRMFDLTASQGLVNVLRGESRAEEAITVIGGAGGFHFLPSGSPRVDPSRLLHGDRLSKLLASARTSFDIVIVDAPPVLPVPDALSIGRWVDGAVLAVRFDASRYPLVERANRRLQAVGVPVIGAVINGVRGEESSYYGPGHPAYGSIGDPEAEMA